jgi:hypothetical protein
VDPAHVLGIKPGEAVVMRNIGGRITPGLLEQLGLLEHASNSMIDQGGGKRWAGNSMGHANAKNCAVGQAKELTRPLPIRRRGQAWQAPL